PAAAGMRDDLGTGVQTCALPTSSDSAAFSPPTSFSVATNSGGSLAASRACNDQYSTGTNARIARSRSTIRRTATDWTRPAESPQIGRAACRERVERPEEAARAEG